MNCASASRIRSHKKTMDSAAASHLYVFFTRKHKREAGRLEDSPAVVLTFGVSARVLMKPSWGDLADIRGDLLLITKPSAMLIESYVEPLG